MFSVFPTLLSFGVLAPFIIRITLGLIFIYISYYIIYKNRQGFFDYYKKNKYPLPGIMTWFLGVLFALSGLFFVIGFLTQVVALVSIYLLFSLYLSDKEIQSFQFSGIFYLLAIVVSFSMLLLGAGAFAIDIPL